MKYLIDENKKAPAYLQLYMQVRDDIIKGFYPLNSKLPSKRFISTDTGVSTVTVEHTYALLCDEGYILRFLAVSRRLDVISLPVSSSWNKILGAECAPSLV